MRFRVLIFCALVVGVGVSVREGFAQERICEGSPTIAPGQAIGKLRLGTSIGDSTQVLGKAELERSGKAGNSEWRELMYLANARSSDFNVYAQDGKIVAMGLGSGTQDTLKCSTIEGVHIGNHMIGKVKKAFGDPDGKYDLGPLAFWVYDKRGLELLVNPQGDVVGIIVFVPGTYCAITDAETTLGWKSNGACADFKPPLSPSQ